MNPADHCEDDGGPMRTALWMHRPGLLHAAAYALAGVVLTGQLVAVLAQGSDAPTVLAVLSAGLGLALSWRFPWTGLALAGAASFAVTEVGRDPLSVWMIAVLVLFSVTFRGHQPLIAIAVVAGFFLAAFMTVGGFRGGAVVGCAALFSAISGGACGAALRIYREHWMVLEARARDALASREIEATRRVAEERLRIARDLHDVVGHQVALISVHLGVAEVALPTGADRSRQALESARANARGVLVETQRILVLLRRDTDPGGEARQPTPGVAALDELVSSYRDAGLDVRSDIDVTADHVDASVGVTIYRVAQEALTNAHRHGPGSATVTLREDDGIVRIAVQNAVLPAGDDGYLDVDRVGAGEGAGEGYGLLGMLERVESCGGSLRVDRTDQLFRVTAEFRALQTVSI